MDKSEKWVSTLKPYEGGNRKKSLIQLILTLTVYIALISFMFVLVLFGYPYWLIILAAIPTAGFHVKTFIIMHDCSHNSYFRNPKTCIYVGRICGLLTFTPFYQWKRDHAIHHASVSNLEKRGVGDVWTMTVQEYKDSPPLKKIWYRIFRNPVFLFAIVPVILFLIIFRLPRRRSGKKELASILSTDAALIVIILIFSLFLGFQNYWLVYLPVVILSTISGVWLFYIQHQFRSVYWAHSKDWNSIRAAMEGSSFYKLPGILRWFSGNIGYHHIHHLNPRIPNYNLKRCYNEVPEVREITPITMVGSLRSAFISLWDEESGKLVNYRSLKKH